MLSSPLFCRGNAMPDLFLQFPFRCVFLPQCTKLNVYLARRLDFSLIKSSTSLYVNTGVPRFVTARSANGVPKLKTAAGGVSGEGNEGLGVTPKLLSLRCRPRVLGMYPAGLAVIEDAEADGMSWSGIGLSWSARSALAILLCLSRRYPMKLRITMKMTAKGIPAMTKYFQCFSNLQIVSSNGSCKYSRPFATCPLWGHYYAGNPPWGVLTKMLRLVAKLVLVQ